MLLDGPARPAPADRFNADALADIELREPASATSTVDGRDIQGWFIPGGDRRPAARS